MHQLHSKFVRLTLQGLISTARKRSLGQGNMFTGVCLSTWGCLVETPPRNAFLLRYKVCLRCSSSRQSHQYSQYRRRNAMKHEYNRDCRK